MGMGLGLDGMGSIKWVPWDGMGLGWHLSMSSLQTERRGSASRRSRPRECSRPFSRDSLPQRRVGILLRIPSPAPYPQSHSLTLFPPLGISGRGIPRCPTASAGVSLGSSLLPPSWGDLGIWDTFHAGFGKAGHPQLFPKRLGCIPEERQTLWRCWSFPIPFLHPVFP